MTSSVRDRIKRSRLKRPTEVETQFSAPIVFEVLDRQTLPKGSLVGDSIDFSPVSPVKTRLTVHTSASNSLLASSFHLGPSKEQSRSVDPSGYVSSDGEESVLTELGVSAVSSSVSLSVSRVGSREVEFDYSPGGVSSAVTPNAISGASGRREGVAADLSRKHSYDFMSSSGAESCDDLFAAESLDFNSDSLDSHSTACVDNEITRYCDSIRRKMEQTVSDVNSLLFI
jgi:hypothetical protein